MAVEVGEPSWSLQVAGRCLDMRQVAGSAGPWWSPAALAALSSPMNVVEVVVSQSC